MSKVHFAEVSISVSMERCLLDMPYEILFKIFCSLPKSKLFEISKLCSKFRDVAGDTRLWKDVCIRYEPYNEPTYGSFAFEELYSEPWPVNVIDLSRTHIRSPICSQSGQAVKVNKLYLSLIKANEVTMKAILAKYQCRELHFDHNRIDIQGRLMGIPPETFSEQSALEVLSLKRLQTIHSDDEMRTTSRIPPHLWLEPIVSNCKNLKTLDLNSISLSNDEMMDLAKNLPTSLEKLVLLNYHCKPENSFFELLAERTPNLRELVLFRTSSVKCPSLLELKFLKILHVKLDLNENVSDLYMYIKNFPALKTVIVLYYFSMPMPGFGKLQKTLEPHGIIAKYRGFGEEPTYPEDANLWKVSKAV